MRWHASKTLRQLNCFSGRQKQSDKELYKRFKKLFKELARVKECLQKFPYSRSFIVIIDQVHATLLHQYHLHPEFPKLIVPRGKSMDFFCTDSLNSPIASSGYQTDEEASGYLNSNDIDHVYQDIPYFHVHANQYQQINIPESKGEPECVTEKQLYQHVDDTYTLCLLYTSPSPRDS